MLFLYQKNSWRHTFLFDWIIGMATKSFHFFPLDHFSRSKSFFSIANFRPYMVFDSWSFIDYSVKKKFQVLLFIYCFALIWNGDSVAELVCSFSFRRFLPQGCTTLWTPNWNWRRQNKRMIENNRRSTSRETFKINWLR